MASDSTPNESAEVLLPPRGRPPKREYASTPATDWFNFHKCIGKALDLYMSEDTKSQESFWRLCLGLFPNDSDGIWIKGIIMRLVRGKKVDVADQMNSLGVIFMETLKASPGSTPRELSDRDLETLGMEFEYLLAGCIHEEPVPICKQQASIQAIVSKFGATWVVCDKNPFEEVGVTLKEFATVLINTLDTMKEEEEGGDKPF